MISEKEKAEQDTFAALNQRDFNLASKIVIAFEAKQEKPRGLNINWKKLDVNYYVPNLKAIFDAKPPILKWLDKDYFSPLRIAASMGFLWGESHYYRWLPKDLKINLNISLESATRMIIFSMQNKINLDQFKKFGYKKVKLSGSEDKYSCPACQKLNNKIFQIDKVIELPYEKCTCVYGCRCEYIAEGLPG
jgi:hypothetical protein